MQDSLKQYVSELIKKKGLSETVDLHQRLSQEVSAYIDQALLEALPLSQLDKLEEAAKDERVNDETIEQLLSESNIDPNQIVRDALDEFSKKYLEGDKL